MCAYIAHKRDDGLLESTKEHTERSLFLGKRYGDVSHIGGIMAPIMVSHDIGKNKPDFKNYMLLNSSEQRKLRGTIKHSSTGAKFLYELYKKRDFALAEFMSYAVAAHHSMFDCVNYLHQDVFLDRVTNVDDYGVALQNAMQEYLSQYDFNQMFVQASEDFEFIKNQIKASYQRMIKILMGRNLSSQAINQKIVLYIKFLYGQFARHILSCVVAADWEATYDFMSGVNTYQKPVPNTSAIFDQVYANFEAYVKDLQQIALSKPMSKREKDLFDARNALLQECLEFAKRPSGIYLLTMAVGGGKTLSGLGYALAFAKYHREVQKIIYCAPYITITRQNASVWASIVGNMDWFLEHHSGIVSGDNTDALSHLMETGWSEQFISTTLVQIINVLFSDKNKDIRLYQALANAVLIIDEVQLIPPESIHTVNWALNYLHDVLNTNIVLCSATQQNLDKADCPLLLSDKPNMIQNPDRWLDVFRRNEIEYIKSKFNYQSLAEYIINNSSTYPSTLIILNTKTAVKKCVRQLRKRGIHAFYLSTNICMEHRMNVLSKMFELLKNHEPVVAVSTNLIECGVDISFSCVYRSLSSLTSLIQSMGRNNRNFELVAGKMFIIELENEYTGCMHDFLKCMRITRQVLYMAEQAGELNDIMSTKWVDKYYELHDQVFRSCMDFPIEGQDETVMDLLTVGYTCKTPSNTRFMNYGFATVGRNYKIIDDTGIPVIVPYGESSRLVQEIRFTTSYAVMRKNLKSLRTKYMVNISESMYKKLHDYIIPLSDKFDDVLVLDQAAYDADFGVVVPGELEDM